MVLPRKSPSLITGAALCALASPSLLGPALAQSFEDLDAIIIEGAGLDARSSVAVGSAVSVITGDDLAARQIAHAGDALATIPGLSIGRSGGVGNETALRIRGAESNHTAVLIDGVDVTSLDFGSFDFSTLLTADIDRIEVLKGPQSGIYAGNALAGVVNIITKKGEGPFKTTARAEAGSFNTRQLSATLSGGNERAHLAISFGQRDTDGYNIARTGTERDGSRQQLMRLKTGVVVSDWLSVDASVSRQTNRFDFDEDTDFDGLLNDTGPLENLREQTIGRIAATITAPGTGFATEVFVSYLADDQTQSGVSAFGNFANEGTRRGYGVAPSYRFETGSARHQILGLIEHRDERFDTTSLAPGAAVPERGQTGLVAEYRLDLMDAWFFSASVRQDLNDTFDDFTTWRGTAAYKIADTGTRLHASIGKGVQLPTFFDQFGIFGNFIGNPALQPEQSLGWDVGVEQALFGGRLVADVTYFRANLTDEIVFSPLPGPGFSYTNVNADGESERQGVEVSLAWRPTDTLTLTGGYTYLDATDPDGLAEIRRPEHQGSVDVAWRFDAGKGLLAVGARYNGRMEDLNFGTFSRVTLDDYVLLTVGGSYAVADGVEVYGRVENALDVAYEDVFSYSGQELAAFAGVKVSLGGGE